MTRALAGLLAVAAASCLLALPSAAATVAPVLRAISGNGSHFCVVTATGSVVCWGRNESAESRPPHNLRDAKVIGAGKRHTCAATPTIVRCWGRDADGQATPPPPEGLSGVTALSAGAGHSCAIAAGRKVVCWGSNTYGMATPPEGLTALSIATGEAHNCAVKLDHTVVCWGRNAYGEGAPPPGLENVLAVTASDSNTCALVRGGTVTCWGRNADGESTPPPGLTGVTTIAGGGAHICAIRSTGTLVCWGRHGDGETFPPPDLTGVTGIASASASSCAIWAGRSVFCWGRNGDGESSPPAALLTGAALPAPQTARIRADVYIESTLTGLGPVRIDTLSIGPVPAGARVTIRCISTCEKRETRVAKQGGMVVSQVFKNLRLAFKSVFVVTASKPGLLGFYDRLEVIGVAQGRPFRETKMCLPATGAQTPISCKKAKP